MFACCFGRPADGGRSAREEVPSPEVARPPAGVYSSRFPPSTSSNPIVVLRVSDDFHGSRRSLPWLGACVWAEGVHDLKEYSKALKAAVLSDDGLRAAFVSLVEQLGTSCPSPPQLAITCTPASRTLNSTLKRSGSADQDSSSLQAFLIQSCTWEVHGGTGKQDVQRVPALLVEHLTHIIAPKHLQPAPPCADAASAQRPSQMLALQPAPMSTNAHSDQGYQVKPTSANHPSNQALLLRSLTEPLVKAEAMECHDQAWVAAASSGLVQLGTSGPLQTMGKALESALACKLERALKILDTSPVIMALVSLEGRVLWMNSAGLAFAQGFMRWQQRYWDSIALQAKRPSHAAACAALPSAEAAAATGAGHAGRAPFVSSSNSAFKLFEEGPGGGGPQVDVEGAVGTDGASQRRAGAHQHMQADGPDPDAKPHFLRALLDLEGQEHLEDLLETILSGSVWTRVCRMRHSLPDPWVGQHPETAMSTATSLEPSLAMNAMPSESTRSASTGQAFAGIGGGHAGAAGGVGTWAAAAGGSAGSAGAHGDASSQGTASIIAPMPEGRGRGDGANPQGTASAPSKHTARFFSLAQSTSLGQAMPGSAELPQPKPRSDSACLQTLGAMMDGFSTCTLYGAGAGAHGGDSHPKSLQLPPPIPTRMGSGAERGSVPTFLQRGTVGSSSYQSTPDTSAAHLRGVRRRASSSWLLQALEGGDRCSFSGLRGQGGHGSVDGDPGSLAAHSGSVALKGGPRRSKSFFSPSTSAAQQEYGGPPVVPQAHAHAQVHVQAHHALESAEALGLSGSAGALQSLRASQVPDGAPVSHTSSSSQMIPLKLSQANLSNGPLLAVHPSPLARTASAAAPAYAEQQHALAQGTGGVAGREGSVRGGSRNAAAQHQHVIAASQPLPRVPSAGAGAAAGGAPTSRSSMPRMVAELNALANAQSSNGGVTGGQQPASVPSAPSSQPPGITGTSLPLQKAGHTLSQPSFTGGRDQNLGRRLAVLLTSTAAASSGMPSGQPMSADPEHGSQPSGLRSQLRSTEQSDRSARGGSLFFGPASGQAEPSASTPQLGLANVTSGRPVTASRGNSLHASAATASQLAAVDGALVMGSCSTSSSAAAGAMGPAACLVRPDNKSTEHHTLDGQPFLLQPHDCNNPSSQCAEESSMQVALPSLPTHALGGMAASGPSQLTLQPAGAERQAGARLEGPGPMEITEEGQQQEEQHGSEHMEQQQLLLEQQQAAAEPMWHEVCAIPFDRDPETGQQAILVMQTDVTERSRMEQGLVKMTEAQLFMLEHLFPRHVLEQIVRRGVGDPAAGPAADLSTAASAHDCVTVMFCDVVGFTSMSKEVLPEQVMEFINDLFVIFDRLVDKWGVSKYDTAGDCYIVIGGLLEEDDEGFMTVAAQGSIEKHAVSALRVLNFARDMLAEAQQVLMPHNQQPVKLRVGLHSGPVVSGLIGKHVPKFSLFGDTMNTASRMESTSQPGRIHVSRPTHELLSLYETRWVPTGGVEVKGKGTMETFLLEEAAQQPGAWSPIITLESSQYERANRASTAQMVAGLLGTGTSDNMMLSLGDLVLKGSGDGAPLCSPGAMIGGQSGAGAATATAAAASGVRSVHWSERVGFMPGMGLGMGMGASGAGGPMFVLEEVVEEENEGQESSRLPGLGAGMAGVRGSRSSVTRSTSVLAGQASIHRSSASLLQRQATGTTSAFLQNMLLASCAGMTTLQASSSDGRSSHPSPHMLTDTLDPDNPVWSTNLITTTRLSSSQHNNIVPAAPNSQPAQSQNAAVTSVLHSLASMISRHDVMMSHSPGSPCPSHPASLGAATPASAGTRPGSLGQGQPGSQFPVNTAYPGGPVSASSSQHLTAAPFPVPAPALPKAAAVMDLRRGGPGPQGVALGTGAHAYLQMMTSGDFCLDSSFAAQQQAEAAAGPGSALMAARGSTGVAHRLVRVKQGGVAGASGEGGEGPGSSHGRAVPGSGERSSKHLATPSMQAQHMQAQSEAINASSASGGQAQSGAGYAGRVAAAVDASSHHSSSSKRHAFLQALHAFSSAVVSRPPSGQSQGKKPGSVVGDDGGKSGHVSGSHAIAGSSGSKGMLSRQGSGIKKGGASKAVGGGLVSGPTNLLQLVSQNRTLTKGMSMAEKAAAQRLLNGQGSRSMHEGTWVSDLK